MNPPFLAVVIAAFAVGSKLVGPGAARAQHFDVLVQQVDGRLVTGSADFDSSQWVLGRRVYAGEFGGNFTTSDPGFNAIPAGSPSLPQGSQALPANTPLEWDFLPMTIDDMTSNLFYWDGMDSDGLPGLTPDDVGFSAPPSESYRLSLFGTQNAKFSADGSDELVPGGIIDDTAANGSIHRHRFFFLEDGAGGQPVDGIYLIAMQLRMSGLENSLPLFLVFGTPGSTIAALDDAAVPWVEQHVDTLVMLGLPGDYNGDGVVDAGDYTVWRDTLGQTVSTPGDGADGDFDGQIGPGDYDVWMQNFGLSAPAGQAAGAVAVVPEPSGLVIMLIAAIGGVALRGRGGAHSRRWESSHS